MIRYKKLISMLVMMLACLTTTRAVNYFTIQDKEGQRTKMAVDRTFSETTVINPFPEKSPISGLCITGSIAKKSDNYLVRIILKAADGHEYCVLESYDEIHDETSFDFSDYCEETALLDGVAPESVRVILKDASIYIESLTGFQSSKGEDKDTSIGIRRSALRREQARERIAAINSYNSTHYRIWAAGETTLSQFDFQTRKKVFGFSDDETTGGFEYYIGGIFEVGHISIPQQPINRAIYVDSFDWRNVQGKNWMTSVKNQDLTNFCSAFSALGCAEALINLYYNKKLDLDLSEQEIADCSHENPHSCYQPLNLNKVFQYLVSNGVCNESAYPMNFHCGDMNWTPVCLSGTIPEQDVARFGGYNSIFSYEDDIKELLLSKGPLVSGWIGSGTTLAHAMTLVGWGKVHVGDTIRWYNEYNQLSWVVIGENYPQINKNYWIFKNSYGTGGYGSYDGYCYVLFENENLMNLTYYLDFPTHVFGYTDNDISIEDLDGDGYYNWGISPSKPSSCPDWVPNTRDDDDTDPTMVNRNNYGFLQPIVNCPYTPIPTHIESDETYTGNDCLSYDIEIDCGCTLTITGTRFCLGNVKIICNGGNIVIDGGVLANANIQFTNTSSSLTIKNGGILYMKEGCDLDIPVGCTVNITSGIVEKRPRIL